MQRIIIAILGLCFAWPLAAQPVNRPEAINPTRLFEREFSDQPSDVILSVSKALTSPNPQIAALMRQYVDGKNVVIGFVDGKAITSEQVKAAFGSELESRTNAVLSGFHPSQREGEARAIAEFQVVFRSAANLMLEEILLREAIASGLQEASQRSQVDVMIETIKAQNGIERDDIEKWAKFTLQNFSLTPLSFREKQVKARMRSLALSLMAGEYGPVKGLKLPLYLPMEVTPHEIRTEYERTKGQYKVQKDLVYDSLAVEFPNSISLSDRSKVRESLLEARRRVAAGESIKDISEDFLPKEFEARGIDKIPGIEIKLALDEKTASDADLDTVGQNTRSVEVGETSQLGKSKRKSGNGEVELFHFVVLKARTSETARIYADPVVQRQIKNSLLEQKRSRNEERVKNALIDRAVLFPNNLLGVTD